MPAIELVAQSPGLLIAGEHLDTLTLAASVEGTSEAADGKFRLAATARTSRRSSRRRSSCVARG